MREVDGEALKGESGSGVGEPVSKPTTARNATLHEVASFWTPWERARSPVCFRLNAEIACGLSILTGHESGLSMCEPPFMIIHSQHSQAGR
jgi:hypothetical protein